MWKKLGIALAVVLVLIAGAAWFLFSNLDGLIKSAIEKYGTAATQAQVSVGGVQLSLTSGSGSISGLTVGNPAGFSTPRALSLGNVSVQIDTNSIAGTGPIIIDSVTISAPQVTYEVKGLGGESNLTAIQNNVQAYAAANGGGQQQPAQGSAAPARKEIIKDLTITDGQVGVASTLLKGKGLSVPLPTIHLTNIGQNGGGATPAEIAQQVLGAITSSASRVGSSALAKDLTGAASGALKTGTGALSNGAGTVTGGAKSLLGF